MYTVYESVAYDTVHEIMPVNFRWRLNAMLYLRLMRWINPERQYGMKTSGCLPTLSA